MRHIEKLQGQRGTAEVMTDVTCDICGKSCWFEHSGYEFAQFWAHWGYGSNKDGINWFCDLCESCAEKIKAHIESLKGTVRIENYF